MKIAYLINQPISLKVITTTLQKFPNAYVYVLNPSFDILEKTHQALLKEAESIGSQKY